MQISSLNLVTVIEKIIFASYLKNISQKIFFSHCDAPLHASHKICLLLGQEQIARYLFTSKLPWQP